MSTKLVEDENTVFEIDEDCMKEKSGQCRSEETVNMEDTFVNIQENPERKLHSGCIMSSCRKEKSCNYLWQIVLLLCMCRR